MTTLVIDASIALKWVIEEDGTDDALAIRGGAKLIAPELFLVECANVLWKKVQRRQLSRAQALLAARLLQAADVELVGTRSLIDATTSLAIELEHPAYDCLYLALALERACRFVTADDRLLHKVARTKDARLRDTAVRLGAM